MNKKQSKEFSLKVMSFNRTYTCDPKEIIKRDSHSRLRFEIQIDSNFDAEILMFKINNKLYRKSEFEIVKLRESDGIYTTLLKFRANECVGDRNKNYVLNSIYFKNLETKESICLNTRFVYEYKHYLNEMPNKIFYNEMRDMKGDNYLIAYLSSNTKQEKVNKISSVANDLNIDWYYVDIENCPGLLEKANIYLYRRIKEKEYLLPIKEGWLKTKKIKKLLKKKHLKM